MAEEANKLVQPLVVPLPPLLDYSDDDGTVVGEDLDENALNSEEEGKMEEEDSQEDSSTMDVDGQGAGAAGGSGVVNEVFYSQPVRDGAGGCGGGGREGGRTCGCRKG